jgi:hypothetical protein
LAGPNRKNASDPGSLGMAIECGLIRKSRMNREIHVRI